MKVVNKEVLALKRKLQRAETETLHTEFEWHRTFSALLWSFAPAAICILSAINNCTKASLSDPQESSSVSELGIKPFTSWMTSAQYSRDGLEVKFPVFQDLPQLSTPFGTFIYTQFTRLPLVDRLALLPLMAAIIDFDNTDTAWRKYDQMLI